jgi:two-component system, cell cycle sensor histidine kinase and response regulator CckA
VHNKAGRTLFQFRTLFQLLKEHAPYGFWIFDPANIDVSYINHAYESMWGRSRDILYDRPFSFLDAVHPQDLAKARTMLERQLRRQATVEDFRIIRPGGEVRWVRDRSFPIQIEPEGTVYAAGTVEYITGSYRTRPRVKHPPKKAMEHLAGGLAHDFNNLLTHVIGNGDFLLRDRSLSGEAYRRAITMLRAADLGKTLVKELTDFSRLGAAPFVSVDLNPLIRGLTESFRSLVGTQIELTTALASDLVSIRANPEQLTRVLTNLVFNARDAMPSGGRISISTYNAGEAGLAHGTGTRFPYSHGYAALEVADIGRGMDSTTQARMFEPFFTTKAYKVGAGVGLYHVKRIVHECHGKIFVSSAVGKGTTFSLYFPRATAGTGV